MANTVFKSTALRDYDANLDEAKKVSELFADLGVSGVHSLTELQVQKLDKDKNIIYEPVDANMSIKDFIDLLKKGEIAYNNIIIPENSCNISANVEKKFVVSKNARELNDTYMYDANNSLTTDDNFILVDMPVKGITYVKKSEIKHVNGASLLDIINASTASDFNSLTNILNSANPKEWMVGSLPLETMYLEAEYSEKKVAHEDIDLADLRVKTYYDEDFIDENGINRSPFTRSVAKDAKTYDSRYASAKFYSVEESTASGVKKQPKVMASNYIAQTSGNYIKVILAGERQETLININDIQVTADVTEDMINAYKTGDMDVLLGKSLSVKVNDQIATTYPVTYAQLLIKYAENKSYQPTNAMSNDTYLRMKDGKYISEAKSIQPISYKVAGVGAPFDAYAINIGTDAEPNILIINKDDFDKLRSEKGNSFKVGDNQIVDASKAIPIVRCEFSKDAEFVQTTTENRNGVKCGTATIRKNLAQPFGVDELNDLRKDFLEKYKKGDYKLDKVYVNGNLEKIETNEKGIPNRYSYTNSVSVDDYTEKEYIPINKNDARVIFDKETGDFKTINKSCTFNAGKANKRDYKTLGQLFGVAGLSIITGPGLLAAMAFWPVAVVAVGAGVLAIPGIPIINGIKAIRSRFVGINLDNKLESQQKMQAKNLEKELELLCENTLDNSYGNVVTDEKIVDAISKIESRIAMLSASSFNNGYTVEEDGSIKVTEENASSVNAMQKELRKKLKTRNPFKNKVQVLKAKRDKAKEAYLKALNKAGQKINLEDEAIVEMALNDPTLRTLSSKIAEKWNAYESAVDEYNTLQEDIKDIIAEHSRPTGAKGNEECEELQSKAENLKTYLLIAHKLNEEERKDFEFDFKNNKMTVKGKELTVDLVTGVLKYNGAEYADEASIDSSNLKKGVKTALKALLNVDMVAVKDANDKKEAEAVDTSANMDITKAIVDITEIENQVAIVDNYVASLENTISTLNTTHKLDTTNAEFAEVKDFLKTSKLPANIKETIDNLAKYEATFKEQEEYYVTNGLDRPFINAKMLSTYDFDAKHIEYETIVEEIKNGSVDFKKQTIESNIKFVIQKAERIYELKDLVSNFKGKKELTDAELVRFTKLQERFEFAVEKADPVVAHLETINSKASNVAYKAKLDKLLNKYSYGKAQVSTLIEEIKNATKKKQEKKTTDLKINSENNLENLIHEKDADLIKYLKANIPDLEASDLIETAIRIQKRHDAGKSAVAGAKTLKNQKIALILQYGQEYITKYATNQMVENVEV